MNPALLAVALVLLASGGAGARAPAEGGKSISHSAANANSVTISRPFVTRTFDGRLTSVARFGATHTLTRDAGHRLTSIAGGGLTQTRAYDGPGKRLSSISFFDGTGDPLGALTYTWNLDQPRLGLAANPWLAISDTLDGAERRTEHWLDDAERLSRVIQPGANGRRQHDYTWRADGARTAETITDPDDTDDEACGENDPCAVPGEACVDGFCRSLETRIVHEFDGLGQLTSIERFTRRQAGNQGWQAEPGSLVDVQSDGWGRITSYQTNGFTRQMTWDVEGRMLSLNDGIDTYQYRDNHRDQRLTRAGPGRDTVHSAWEADGLLAERFDGANPDVVRTHLRGAGMVLGVDDVAFGLDHLGSPVLRWNGAAAITRFDAWGAQLNGNVPQFGHESVGYTGHGSDAESKLTYAQARYYDPGIGHFLSPDPWSGALEMPGTLQKYAYGLGNPLRYTDPDGREPTVLDHGGYCGGDPRLRSRIRSDEASFRPHEMGLYEGGVRMLLMAARLDDLVRRFADCTEAQWRCIHAGDSRTGNKHARKQAHAFNKLRSHGDSGREALRALLVDGRPEVRSTAAAFLLRYCHGESAAVLEEVAAQHQGLLGFSAAQALLRWQEGTWSLDSADD